MLRELQHCFAAAVVRGDVEGIEAEVVADAPGAAARVGIYLNHFRITLIDALAANFPVVKQLVGDGFFSTIARRFVCSDPPVNPCLFAYGDGFPSFLESVPEARPVPYLADVARLEWAINQAWHAADSAPDASPLSLHPSCRLVTSPFPIDQIWRAHQGCASELEAIDLNAGGVRLLVSRQDDEVGWIHLAPAAFGFLDSLMAQVAGQDALATARALDPSFDPVPLLAALIEAGLIASPSPTTLT